MKNKNEVMTTLWMTPSWTSSRRWMMRLRAPVQCWRVIIPMQTPTSLTCFDF